jgi:hypothetical protein
MKPIEAGCKARVVKSHNGHEGKIVTVIKSLGSGVDGVSQRYGDRWKVNGVFPTNDGKQIDHFGECQLERIDYDGNEKTEWESIKTDDGVNIWTPERVAV